MADAPLTILINGVDKTALIFLDSLTIRDVVSQPKTCTFTTLSSYQPPAAATIVIARGTFSLFAGSVVTIQQLYVGAVTNCNWAVTAINYNFLLRRRRPIASYTATSASTIAAALISSFTTTFTSTNVQASLASVTTAFDGSQDVAGCLSALATLIGGYWYVDEARDLHFFLTESSSAPDALDNSNTSALNDPPVTQTIDYSQIQTRVYVKGAGSSTELASVVGQPYLSVQDISIFSGSGGEVIAVGQRITYTGTQVAYTAALASWTSRSGGSGVQQWTAICWSPERSLFVAVSGTTSALGVMTSPDGITWTTRTPASSATWEGIAWSPALLLFVAVDGGGKVMSSPDGITWTSQTASALNAWQGICWSPALALFCAVSTTGTNRVMTSPDGVTWTARSAASVTTWNKVCWAPALGLFAAVSTSGTNAVMTSPDGTTWTLRTTANLGNDIAWSQTLSLFVVVAGTVTMTSPDGVTWTSHAAALPSANWKTIVWSDTGFFVTVSDAATNNIAVSTDGILWTLFTGPATSAWRGIAWSPTLGRLVAVGFTATPTSTIMTNDVAAIFGLLTGVPTSSAGSITAGIPAGSAVNLFVQRDDLTAQAALALIEDGGASDGIHVGYVSDDALISVAECNAAGDAELTLYKNPITTITYATHDLKTRSGKSIAVNRTHPPIALMSATIQDVTITNLHIAAPGGPLFTVTASSVMVTLQDILTRLIEGVSP